MSKKGIGLSIIIPVYNEEKTIKQIISDVKSVKFPLSTEIVVINDCSTDNSLKILNSIKGIKLLSNQTNKGKGFSVRKAIENSSSSIIVIQDADLEYDPEELLSLLKVILSGESVVYGSRFLGLKSTHIKNLILSHFYGNKFLSFVTSVFFSVKITDVETCYKMFRRSAIEDIVLISNGFNIEPEITAKILRKGLKIAEVPISHNARTYSLGKKITKFDGLMALWTLIRFRFF